MERIVVGLIDTPSARAALRWAVRQASATGALIEVVTCVPFPQGSWWYDTPGISTAPMFTPAEMRCDVQAMLERVLRQEFGARLAAMPVRATTALAEPAAGLVRAAAGADLLAVGRPSRRFRFLRRSIGVRCSQLFEGPVVLVPEDHEGDADIDAAQAWFDADRTIGQEFASRK